MRSWYRYLSVMSFLALVSVNPTFFTVGPVENCEAIELALAISGPLSVAATSFLFFLRVRAVYLRSKCVTVVFGVLCAATVAVDVFARATFHAGQYIQRVLVHDPLINSLALRTLAVGWILWLHECRCQIQPPAKLLNLCLR